MPSLARSVPKPLKVPSLARSVSKPLKVPSLARSVPKPLKVPSLARSRAFPNGHILLSYSWKIYLSSSPEQVRYVDKDYLYCCIAFAIYKVFFLNEAEFRGGRPESQAGGVNYGSCGRSPTVDTASSFST